MAQQINLYLPVMMAPRHRFSARAMALALLVLAGLLSLACLGAWWTGRSVSEQHARLSAAQRLERAQLQQALQTARQLNDPEVLERQRQGLQLEVQRLREQLVAQDSDRLPPGQRHSVLLALIARTVPDNAWVTELDLRPSSVECVGVTLDPAALQRWIASLAQEPSLAGQPVADLRVEQVGQAHQGLQASRRPAEAPLQVGPLPTGPAWAFRLKAQRPLMAAPAAPVVSPPQGAKQP